MSHHLERDAQMTSVNTRLRSVVVRLCAQVGVMAPSGAHGRYLM